MAEVRKFEKTMSRDARLVCWAGMGSLEDRDRVNAQLQKLPELLEKEGVPFFTKGYQYYQFEEKYEAKFLKLTEELGVEAAKRPVMRYVFMDGLWSLEQREDFEQLLRREGADFEVLYGCVYAIPMIYRPQIDFASCVFDDMQRDVSEVIIGDDGIMKIYCLKSIDLDESEGTFLEAVYNPEGWRMYVNKNKETFEEASFSKERSIWEF